MKPVIIQTLMKKRATQRPRKDPLVLQTQKSVDRFFVAVLGSLAFIVLVSVALGG